MNWREPCASNSKPKSSKPYTRLEIVMANPLKPTRATSSGRILLRELEARGWSQRDLAAVMGRSYQAINQIVRGVKCITPETARELAQAFGTSPELWMNLEVNCRF
jgi:addiction module HigA family antidote